MPHSPKWAVVLLIAMCGTSIPASGQADRLVPMEDWSYEYISRLQRRGFLLQLNPTALPYTQSEVAEALADVRQRRLRGSERFWFRMLADRFSLRKPRRDAVLVGGWLGAGAAAATNDRLDPLRYTDSGRPTLQSGDVRIFPRADLHLYANLQPFVAEVGLQHDVFYDVDPDGIDAVKRLYVRNEDAYVGVNLRYLGLYLGRFGNHWGTYREPAMLVSDNPRSYDLIQFRLGRQRLALRSLFGELDAATLAGEFTGKPADVAPRPEVVSRYVSAHRIDWRPSPNVVVSLSESALYSGRDAGPSLKFANPVHTFLFLIDNAPKNEEPNGFFAGSVWARHRDWTGTVALLLDDFDILNLTEPSSLAANVSVKYAGASWVHTGASMHAVTALAYNTHQPEGKYLYLLRGIASEFSDFVHVRGFASFYPGALPAFTVEPQLHLLWQGQGDITDPFPADLTERRTILTGVVERTVRVGSGLRYQPDPRAWVAADLGFNWTGNDRNRTGINRVRFVGLLEFGLRLSLDRRYGLSF